LVETEMSSGAEFAAIRIAFVEVSDTPVDVEMTLRYIPASALTRMYFAPALGKPAVLAEVNE